LKWETLCKLGRELPEVCECLWYRTQALSVRGRGFVRLKEDGRSVVFRLGSPDEQEFLTRTKPNIYFITDHYRGYAAVLARLSALPHSECRARLETAWRAVAPRGLVKKREAPVTGAPGPSGHPSRVERRPRAALSRPSRGPLAK
jgi:hypothetical protein